MSRKMAYSGFAEVGKQVRNGSVTKTGAVQAATLDASF